LKMHEVYEQKLQELQEEEDEKFVQWVD
jgi:hypothetical protein